MKKIIILFSLVFLFFGFGNNVLVFAEEVVDVTPPIVTSYTLNGLEDNIVFNPNDPVSVEIVINANKSVKFNYIYICAESDEVCNGTTRIKEFTQTSFNTSVTKSWDGKKSPATAGMAPDGIYKIKIKMVDEVNKETIVVLSPHTITIDTLEKSIEDKTLPIITLVGETTINLNIGGVYEDAGATALDDIDGDITSSIVKNGSVDTSTVGTYTITYDVKDLAGNNATQVTRIINITDDDNVIPTPSPVNINLKVYSGDTVLFDDSIAITACAESPEIDALMTFNGKCAIEQSGLSNTWTWYDSNFSTNSLLPKTLGILDELGGSTSDNINYIYWGWFNDLNYGTVALNKHILGEGEELLLTYNSYPLKISASKTSGVVGDTVVFTAEEKSTFDENYNMIWTPSLDVVISLGDQTCITVSGGTCSILLNKAGSFNVVGSKSLYVPSSFIKIEVIEQSSGVGGGNTTIEKTFSVPDALDFLLKNKESVSIALINDWIAISAGAGDNSILKSSLVDYLKSNPIDSNIVTENERRAMALMSLDINPHNGTEINYIKKIVDSFDGVQLGDIDLVNDDVFGLIVLQNTGYKEEDEIIEKIIEFIIDNQDIDGSFGSIDMTVAVIMALKNFEDVAGVSDTISKAENYIIKEQNEDGGFGNSFATSWAIQALSLNNAYDNEVKDAIEYLADEQQNDGGLGSGDINSRIWATAYAIPAILELSWSDILNDFDKIQKEITENSNLGSSNNFSNNQNEEIISNKNVIPEVLGVESIKKISITPKKVYTYLDFIDQAQPVNTFEEIKDENVQAKDLEEKLAVVEGSDLFASAGLSTDKDFLSGKNIILFISIVIAVFLGGFVIKKTLIQ